MDEDERQMRQQLMLHEALVQAIDRRDEVFQVIEDSQTDRPPSGVGRALTESGRRREFPPASACRLLPYSL